MIGYWWILIVYVLGALISGSILPLWAFRIKMRIAYGLMPKSDGGRRITLPAPLGIKWVDYHPNIGMREKPTSSGGCPVGGIICIEVIGWPITWTIRLMRTILHSSPITTVFSKTNRVWYYIFTTKEERVQQALGTLNVVNDTSTDETSPGMSSPTLVTKWTTIPNPTGKYVP